MIRSFGMDYGIKPKMMLLSDIGFQDELRQAKFTGFMYVFCKDLQGEMIPMEVGFRFEDEEHAEKFFDSLIGWWEKSDGDSKAVSIEFTEMNDGDYTIVVAPDMDMFIKRMLPEHLIDRVDPLTMMASRSLRIVDQSGNFKEFKEKYVEGRRIVVRYFIPHPEVGLRPSEKYFVKEEFTFHKEDALPKDSNAYMNLKGGKKDVKKRPPIAADHPGLLKHRLEDLKYFFPVLLDKVDADKWLAGVITTINKSYTEAQIKQAICNLTLLERLKKNEGQPIDMNKPGYDLEIITYLAENFESFDSYFPEDSYFTKQVIEKQIRADAKFLKEKLAKP
jgi:hypothetical protein